MTSKAPSPRREPKGILSLLSAATCEWFLLFLLFVDALLYYLAIRFAKYCKLQIPCVLCSRLDEKKNGSYWSFLCVEHREELSSSVCCSLHEKFVDANGMCVECLTPAALRNISNLESYRLLLGKSWVEVDRSLVQNLLANKNIKLCSSGRRTCSCCCRIFRTRSDADRLFELGTVGLGASKANMKPPLPRARGRSRFGRRDGLKRLRNKFTGSTSGKNAALSHVGYTMLKISSDTDSDFHYSEDDEGGDFRCRNCRKVERQEAQSDLSGSADKPPPVLDQPNLLDLSEPTNDDSGYDFMDQLLVDLNWDESSKKTDPSFQMGDLLSLIDGSEQSEESCVPQVHAISRLSEFLSLCNSPKDDTTPKKAVDTSLLNASFVEMVSRNDPPVNDAEGESIVDQLKRQIESYQNSINLLYKDLEEERNASAIAANASMAKMTQLEEEKAALKMEALQYLRMMEEQAEYDMEALERANDHIAEKEKEIQDLEYELEFYRNNLPDDISDPNALSISSFEAEKQSISTRLSELEKRIKMPMNSKNEESFCGDGDDERIIAAVNEIGRLRDRLEALESDRVFLMHTCELLQKGDEGLELVQEIAQHLQDLKQMELSNKMTVNF